MSSYKDYFRSILEGSSLEDKLEVTTFNWDEWSEYSLPAYPSREEKIKFSSEQLKFPKKDSLRIDEKKAMALHSFANHELLAIEMMAAAILVFPHKTDDDIKIKKGIFTALKDEQKHFKLYVNRLNELGFEFGDFPLNDFFWRQMPSIKSMGEYFAVMALTFEAANLDFAQYYKNVFLSFDDHKTAQILDIVLEDEISHVALGSYWMKKWRVDKSLWQYYLDSLPWPLTPARSRGIGFDPLLHSKAMGDDDFISQLKTYEDPFRITKRKN
ncbi:MAG: DUF455 family protein [Bacteriovoracaceae bacterium]